MALGDGFLKDSSLGLLRTEEIEGCGHAPALNVPEQWKLVMDFLKSVH